MTMIEKVARAIYEARNGRGCKSWQRLPKSHREPYLSDARAAIAAMRDPTDKQVDAMRENIGPLKTMWRVAIDAAFNEAKQETTK